MRARGDRSFKSIIAGGVATSLLAGFGSAASAQEAGPTGEVTSSEIVVTANKREQRLLEVPLAVSAISGAELQATQTLDLQDLQVRVPGLRLFSGGGTQNRIVIRGQNAGGDGATVVSLIDEVPLGFSNANNGGGFVVSDFDTYDLSRVEVLRGPQGTLYGATAEAGLIKYVSNAPDPTAFGAGFELGAYSVEHGGNGEAFKGFLNVPLGAEAAFRISGYYEELPGFIDDSFRGLEDYNSGERVGGRASFLWQPTEDLSIRALAYHQEKTAASGDIVTIFGPGPNLFELANDYDLPSYFDREYTTTYDLGYVDVGYDFGFAEFQSITSFGEADNQFFNDVPSFAGLLTFFAGEPASVRQVQTIAVEKVNQEFRLASPENPEARFDWQVGLFYTKEEVNYVTDLEGLAYPSGAPLTATLGGLPLGVGFGVGRIPSEYEALAGYADTTIRFTPQFDLQLGARVERNEQTSRLTLGGAFYGFPVLEQDPLETSESVFTYSIAPRLRITPDVISYLRIAKGYRPGGPQIPLPGQPPEALQGFESDSTVNYELGLKGEFFEGQLTADLAAFFIDWDNIQISESVVIDGIPYSRTGNGGSALSRGVEWSLEYRPAALEGLTVDLVGAYTEAYLTEDAPGLGALDDDRLNFVPKWSVTLAANHEWELDNGMTTFVGVDASHVSSRPFGYGAGVFILPSYDLYNARVGLRRDNWTVQLYGKNLSDELGLGGISTGVGAPDGTGFGAAILRPRTYGLMLTSTF